MTIKTLTTQEATEQLRRLGVKISTETMRNGLRQGVFPFGTYIETPNGSPVYTIYERLFLKWIEERAFPDDMDASPTQ